MRSPYEISEEIQSIYSGVEGYELNDKQWEDLRQQAEWLLDDWKTEIQELT